jgi:hypothetical protein
MEKSMSAGGFLVRVVVTLFTLAGFIVALACLQAWLEGDFDSGPPDAHGNERRPR